MTCFEITCQNTPTLQTGPTLATHATTKGYMNGAISTANSKTSTGTVTNSTFTISGLTLVGLSRELQYSKVGAAVTGTLVENDINTQITAPLSSVESRVMAVSIQKNYRFYRFI